MWETAAGLFGPVYTFKLTRVIQILLLTAKETPQITPTLFYAALKCLYLPLPHHQIHYIYYPATSGYGGRASFKTKKFKDRRG